MRIILGSLSPRRKEIMNYFTLPFEQANPNFDEDKVPFEGNPYDHVNLLSGEKAASLAPKNPGAIIITADTIVFHNGRIFEKPKDKEEAFVNTQELSGKWHTVFTGVTVRKDSTIFQAVDETRVLFNTMTPEQIRLYHQQLHCEDKAGGYAIQHAGAIVAKKIEGCFYNVMGLPINTLRELLLNFNIDLWHHLKP